MKKRPFSILILLTATAFLFAQESNDLLVLKNKIDNYLSAGIPNGFSGSMFVLKEGQIILKKGYGMADKEKKIPYTPNTVASIGSVTKQFTATAILKLEEFKKLKITDSLHYFFKDIPEDKKDITIHQLLTHSSGLIDDIGAGDFDDLPENKYFQTLFETELLHPPGSKYAYSNAGFSLLAKIIEITSGQEYENFLYEFLFEPAGMMQTGYFIPQWKEESIAKGYAYGFISVGSMIERYEQMKKISWSLKGNGGIHSTAEDMYKWHQALKAQKIITKISFNKLTTPYIQENETGTSHYGYGWAIYESNRHTKLISHNGGNGIYFHDFIWSPEENALIILFTNAASSEAEVAWKINKMLFDSTYIPDPIKKNLHLFVFNFMQTKSLQDAEELTTIIKREYLPKGTSSYILNDLGYDILRFEIDDNIKWAIEIFKLNVELFPTDGNNWDSLGEAYLLNGQKALALKSYKKALALASDSNCGWCKSSADAIKVIGRVN